MNHIELYEQQHGKDAAKVYAFTLIQIQLIQGMNLLHNGELSDDEMANLVGKLSKLSSTQIQMYTKTLPLDDDAIQDAMEAASDYMHSETFGETIQ